MRKLLKKFVTWVMRDDYEQDVPVSELRPGRKIRMSTVSAREVEIRSSGMTFNLYAAEGGTVIETTFYDQKNDRNDHRLYIIPDGEDFTNTLGQIVSMERIKSWH